MRLMVPFRNGASIGARLSRGAKARGAGTVLVLAISLMAAAPGSASANSAWWGISSSGVPTNLPPSGPGVVVAFANNIGDSPIEFEASPVTIKDILPPGLKVTEVHGNIGGQRGEFECNEPQPREVVCLVNQSVTLPPYVGLEVVIHVEVEPGAASGGQNEVSVSGGGAPPATHRAPLAVGTSNASFGLENFEITAENEGGAPDQQAGSHPFQLRTRLALTTAVEDDHYCENCEAKRRLPIELPRTVSVKLPPGLVGNPTTVPECTDQEFGELGYNDVNYCPSDTAVGVVTATLDVPIPLGVITHSVPLFNLVPRPGEPARFGFVAEGGVPVTLDTSLRTGGDYGITVTANNLSEAAGIISTEVTFWGVPSDSKHDQSRGWKCIDGRSYELGPCEETTTAHPESFLSLPGSCEGPLHASVGIDSWKNPGTVIENGYSFGDPQAPLPALGGCENLPFEPSFSAAPDTESTTSPAGLTLNVRIPQESSSSTASASEANLRDTTVQFPEGLVVNPSSARGLVGCTLEAVALSSPGPGSCPEASKVGTVEIHTPLLREVVGGDVYVATQGTNPFGSLLALYIVANDPAAGVVVKLPVDVTADSTTGRLSGTVSNAPQLPFEELTLHLFGGSRGVLVTPKYCGTYLSGATFTPWSGTSAVSTSGSFGLTSGAGGSPCAFPQPFSAELFAGSATSEAAAFSPLATSITRPDQSQTVRKVQFQLPAGLLGKLSSVQRCPEPQASEGTCPAASLIGHVAVKAGLGSEPFDVAPGAVYVTNSYEGAPFGLSIAEPAKAGPFDLGSGPCDCVVIRAQISVNPTTAALTVTTDPLPQILDGIPLAVRSIKVNVERTGFTFNPTDCKPMSIAANLEGAGAGALTDAIPFQVANCASLPFKPSFTATAAGRASKPGGASLTVKVASKGGPGTSGEEANIRSVKVDLPKQLPSRLTTLQKACTAAQFESNPAGCPKESDVGTATARTPILAVPLTGPAYLVSHGGEAFPDLEIVLQGEGVKLVLDGNTLIKKGITSSTFRTVPDAPISSFELKLPTGKFSILGTNLPQGSHYSLCGQTLNMPTAITGQNGAEIHETTKIAVSGCKKAKPAKKKAKAKKKKAARRKK